MSIPEVKLKNGEMVPEPALQVYPLILTELLKDDPLAFVELVWLCRDPNHKLWSDAIAETLRRRELIDGLGQPHSITRNYILSGVTGDNFDMRLVDPRA